MNTTIECLLARQSLRAYADTAITEEQKSLIIQCAMRAPTAGNMMLYSMIEVSDQQKKNRLVTTCDNQPFIAKAPLVLLFLADMQRWYDYYAHCDVSAFCRKNGLVFDTPAEADLMLASCDALIAAQNAVIAAESMGIGSCYIGDIMENIEIHREMFELPDLVFPITMLCFGHMRKDATRQKITPRFPQDTICFTDRYRRLGSSDYDSIFMERFEGEFSRGKYLKNAENIGQHYYLKKTGADFFKEMRRSVKAAIKAWIGKQ